MPNKNQESEGEVNRDNTKIISGHFSASLRTRTIAFFAIALLIPFICVVLCLSLYIPSLYDKYEDKLAASQVDMFLDTVQDGIAPIRAGLSANVYMRAIARVIESAKYGDYTLLNRYWSEILYMGGEWIKNPFINVVALVDGVELKALRAEYHPTGENGNPMNESAPFVPEIFLGETAESKDFIQKQIDIYANMESTGVLGDVVNCNGSFMVGAGPIMSSKLDTRAVGYLIWGVELSSKINEFSKKNDLCVTIWDSKENLPSDYLSVIDKFGDNTPYSINDTEFLVKRHSGKVHLGKSYSRACPTTKPEGILTYEYLKLGKGYTNKTYIRLERERSIENRNNRMGNIMVVALIAFYIFSFVVLIAYLELIVLKRLKMIRDSITKLSAMDGYSSGTNPSDDDDLGGYTGDPFDEDNNNNNGSSNNVPHDRRLDEIGNLRFLAKMQVETLRRRYTDTINRLRTERVINDHIYDVIALMSLTKERRDKKFIRARLPKSPCASDLSLHHAFTCPVTLEFFKDYCADVGKLSYIFFFLDIMWLRTLEATAAASGGGGGGGGGGSGKKKQNAAGAAAVAAAKMIGQKYILRKGSSYIELKKETRQKICALESYAVGMYDEAYEEVVEILDGLLAEFGKSHQYKEATTILSIKAGDP